MKDTKKSKRTHEGEKNTQQQEFKKQTDAQSITVKDKKVTADTAKKLKQAGTKEGAQNVKKEVEKGGKSVDTHMDRQKKQHDDLATKGKKVEGEVKKASDASGSDAKSAKDAAGKIKYEGGRKAMQDASKSAQEDEKWLSDLKKRREKDRQSSENKTKEQAETVKKTEVQVKG